MRSGSTLDALLADACVVVSLLLQHGVEPADLVASMGRLGKTEPASVIEAVIDLVAQAMPDPDAAGGLVMRPDPQQRRHRRAPRRMSSGRMLAYAAGVIAERDAAYGNAATSMAEIAARWSITLGCTIKPAQVVQCMIDLKLVRLAHDPKHLDSIADVIGYAALLPQVTP
jgi:hypothetical protein